MNNKVKQLILVFALIVGLGAIYFFFLKDSKFLKIDKSPEVRRINGFPTTVYTQKDLEKIRTVIKTKEELTNFLNSVDESGYLIMREEIDFNKEMLLAATTSSAENEGQEIKIKKLYEDKDANKLLVSVRETEPGETCEKILNKNVSVDLVAISNTTREIEFERVKEIKECQ